MFRLPASLCCKPVYSLTPPSCLLGAVFSELLRCCLPSLGPNWSHQIKLTLYFQVLTVFFSPQLVGWRVHEHADKCEGKQERLKTWVMGCVCLFSHLQLFVTPMDCSPSRFFVHGISEARLFEWVGISSEGSFWPRDWTHVSCISWIGRWILYHWAVWEALLCNLLNDCKLQESKKQVYSVQPLHPYYESSKTT